MHRSVPLVVAAIVLGASPAPAWSQVHSEKTRVTTIRVPIGDLDLSNEAGADTFLQRVSIAAARACGGSPALGVMIMLEAQAYRACKEGALSRAVAQVGSPVVSERYAQRPSVRTVKVAEVRP